MNDEQSYRWKVCYVILHYNTIDKTIQCISSVLKQKIQSIKTDVKIIIVDNGSLNNSGKILQKKYETNKAVHIIIEKENHGFARGNNIGYQYAMYQEKPDIIILSNNDIELRQENFFDIMINIYNKEKFAVCGPDIYSPYKQVHQNPLREHGFQKEDIEKLIQRYKRKTKIFQLLKWTRSYFLFHKMKLFVHGLKNEKMEIKKEQNNVVLHGAFLILGQEYIKAFPEGLYPGTFMYLEEGILYYLCQKKDLKMIYCPALNVLHDEGSATRALKQSRVNKAIFEFETTIQSAEIFLKLMEEHS